MDLDALTANTFERNLYSMLVEHAQTINHFPSMEEARNIITFIKYVDDVNYQLPDNIQKVKNNINRTIESEYNLTEYPELWI